MTCNDILISVGIGILTGLVSGIIASEIVTRKYNKIEEDKLILRQLEEDRGQFIRFIRIITNEIKYAIRHKEYEQLNRTIRSMPRFNSFNFCDIKKEIEVDKDYIELVKETVVIILEIQEKINEPSIIPDKELWDYHSALLHKYGQILDYGVFKNIACRV